MLSIPATVLIESWAIFKGELPVMLVKSNVRCMRQAMIDAHKAACYQALWAVDKNHSGSASAQCLQIYRKPDVVLVSSKVAKDALTLVPFGPLQSICIKEPTHGVWLGNFELYDYDSTELYISAPPKPTFVPEDPTSIPEKSMLVPILENRHNKHQT